MATEDKIELLFETILGDPIDEYGHYNLILAGQCLSEMTDIRMNIMPEFIDLAGQCLAEMITQVSHP